VRVVLLACFVIHIVAVVQLAQRNRAARPDGYPAPRIARSLSSRTMLVGGLFLLAFVIFHILHFTTGTIDPGAFAEGAVYHNLLEAFESPVFLLIYVAAVTVLGFHLYHAVWSSIQTAGWDRPNRNPTFRRLSAFTAIVVAVGFAAVPIAFWTGILD
jgi:succinate dehydrogenase / fumarate reductase cytochrome b subunit